MDNKKFDMKNMISNASEAFVTAMLFTGMCVIFVCAIVGVIMLFRGEFLIVLFLLLLAAGNVLLLNRIIKRDDLRIMKKKHEYRQKYITAMKVIDLELGELYFEQDSKEGTLTLLHGIPALIGDGELTIEAEDCGLDTLPLRECLKRVLKDKDRIVEGMLNVVRDVYEDEDITEEEAGGDPTDRDYILSRLRIHNVYLSVGEDGGWSACISGGMDNSVADHIGEHGISADFSNDSPDYDFYSG